MARLKKGDEVWVKGVYGASHNGMAWVTIQCDHAMRDIGECDVKVSRRNVKPSVVFKWSPAKKKGAKK